MIVKAYSVFTHGTHGTMCEVFTVKKNKRGKYDVLCTYIATTRDDVQKEEYAIETFKWEESAYAYLNNMYADYIRNQNKNETITAY